VTRDLRVLLVDDDIESSGVLGRRLHRDGFEVTIAGRGADALAVMDRHWPDLVILEMALPDMRGEHLAAQIKRQADLPIIVLSTVSDGSAKAAAIRDFAEDYVVKPVHYPELKARMDRILRRLEDRIPAEEQSPAPGLTLILRKRQAIVDGRAIRLTPIETRLLATLAAAGGNVVTTEQLLAHVWQDSDAADPVYVWVAVRRLRLKLEPDPSRHRFLHTADGGGYFLGSQMPEPGP
jgi:DNA-binding response OmpR family regulator